MPRQKVQQPRYRYINKDTALGTDAVSEHQLISGTKIHTEKHGAVALRVNLPRDVRLTKEYTEPFSTTTDTRTLDELGYDIMVFDGNRKLWKIRNEYKGVRPCDIDVVRDHPKSDMA